MIKYLEIIYPKIEAPTTAFTWYDATGTGLIPWGQSFPDNPDKNLKVYTNGIRIYPDQYTLNYLTLTIQVNFPIPGVTYLVE